MRNFIKISATILSAITLSMVVYLALAPASVSAQLRIITAPQGGTGIGSATAGQVGNCLTVADDSPFTYSLSSCAAGGGAPFAWTVQSWGVSTSTRLGFLNGFLSTASSTITASTTIQGALTSTGGFYALGLSTCESNNVLTWSGGTFGCEADDSGSGGGFDFPSVLSWGNATSTTLGFLNGFISTASPQ